MQTKYEKAIAKILNSYQGGQLTELDAIKKVN